MDNLNIKGHLIFNIGNHVNTIDNFYDDIYEIINNEATVKIIEYGRFDFKTNFIFAVFLFLLMKYGFLSAKSKKIEKRKMIIFIQKQPMK